MLLRLRLLLGRAGIVARGRLDRGAEMLLADAFA